MVLTLFFVFWKGEAYAQYCTPQYTAPCVGPAPLTADYINNFSTSGGIVNIVNNNSGCNGQPNSFIYYANQTVSAAQGCSFNVSMQAGQTQAFQQGFAIWVDWNNDSDYNDAGELVFSSPPTLNVVNGTIQIPANASLGIKRMRVRCTFAVTPTSPCNVQGIGYGEVEEYNLEVLEPSDASVEVSDLSICAGTSAQITANSSGIVRWYFSPTSTTPIGIGPAFTTPVLNNTTTYWVQATVGSCVGPRLPIVVTVVPPFNVDVSASENPVCSGTPFTLTATAPITGLSYSWTPTSAFNDATVNPPEATITSNTTFNVTATDPISGCTGTGSLAVNVLPAAAINVSAVENEICQGLSTELIAAGGGPNYTWSPTTGLSSTTGANVTASPNTTTTYTVVSPASSGACAATGAITITVNPGPIINAGVSQSICEGSSTNLSGSGASTYAWSPATGLSNSNIDNPIASPVVTTIYTLTGTSASGCVSEDEITITVNPLPIANPGSGAANCSGLGAQLNGSGGVSYQWSPATGLSSATIANPIASPATSTDYTLTVSDGNGCTSSPSAPITVTVFQQPPAPAITAVGQTTFCEGGSVQLNAPASSAYLWSNGETTQSITVNQSGNFTVQITDVNGCTSPSSAPVTVTVNLGPAQPVINASGPLTFCDGGSVSLTSSGVGNFAWNSGEITQVIEVDYSGSFEVTVTDGNGCTATSSPVEVIELASLSAPVISATGPLSFCPGGSVTLQTSGAASYLWSTGETTPVISTNQSGFYHVTITDVNGCVSPQSVIVETTLNPNPATPTIAAVGNYPLCVGENLSLSSSASSQYLWSNGLVSQTITIDEAEILTVTVTDANGCTSSPSLPFEASFFPLPASPQISANGPSSFCDGETVTLSAIANGAINWNNGLAGEEIQVNLSGQYTATVIDANGCESLSSSPIQVNVVPTPANASISLSGPSDICEGDSVLLTSSLAPAYSWSNGSTDQSIWVKESGEYTVSISGTTCPPNIDNASQIVQVRPIPVPEISASSYRDCVPAKIAFSMNTQGIGPFSYLWRFGDGNISDSSFPTNDFEDTGLFDVTLTLTDVIGCQGEVSEKEFIEILPREFARYSINPKVTTFSSPEIILTSHNDNVDSLIWDLGELGIFYGDSVFITLPDTGIYPLTYTVVSAAGCEVEELDDIRMVDDFTIYVPNGFTPNDDELNDIFKPIVRGIDTDFYQFSVFNRWGQEMFSTNDPEKGWDGQQAQIDVYVYKISARGLLGEDRLITGEIHLIK